VTQQETTFTRTISRNLRLQTKTPEKEHVNMASQALDFHLNFQVLWLTPLL